jgi:hypothetical protein
LISPGDSVGTIKISAFSTGKAFSAFLEEVRGLERKVIKALDKGGVVVVETGGALITTYNLDSYDRGQLDAR